MCRHLRRLIPYLRRGYATKYTGKVVTSINKGRFSAIEVSVTPPTLVSDVCGYLVSLDEPPSPAETPSTPPQAAANPPPTACKKKIEQNGEEDVKESEAYRRRPHSGQGGRLTTSGSGADLVRSAVLLEPSPAGFLFTSAPAVVSATWPSLPPSPVPPLAAVRSKALWGKDE